jgi:hypothetical protein
VIHGALPGAPAPPFAESHDRGGHAPRELAGRVPRGGGSPWVIRATLACDGPRGHAATERLLTGDPDAARATGMLPEDALAALRDRVDVDLSPRNPASLGAGDAVVLAVLVKNGQELVIKVFRINARAYFLARGEEVEGEGDKAPQRRRGRRGFCSLFFPLSPPRLSGLLIA